MRDDLRRSVDTGPSDDTVAPPRRRPAWVRHAVRPHTMFGLVTPPILLGVLSAAGGLSGAGWVAGLAAGWGATALLARARSRHGEPAMSPADWVTLTRLMLCAGVAGLVADSFARSRPLTALVALAAVALPLDAVDGQVARRTGTASKLGASFDAEVDAFLILLLSVEVSRLYGSWVLLIGAAHYAFLAAGLVLPWLAAPLPRRTFPRVVAAVQGIVLIVAASGVVSRPAGMIAVGVALALLVCSFGQSVHWLYRAGATPRTRRVVRRTVAIGAVVIVWFVLVAPAQLNEIALSDLIRIPIEGLVLVGLGLIVPARARRVVAAVAGAVFGLIVIVKALDIGWNLELGRPFNPVLDWANFTPAFQVVSSSLGTFAAVLLAAGLVAVLALIVGLAIASTVHISAVTARHRRRSAQTVLALGVVWVLCAAFSFQIQPGLPVASASTASVAASQVILAERAEADKARFATALHSPDPYAAIPGSDLFSRLRGKDVIVIFVEAYGRVAVEGVPYSAPIDAMLRQGTKTLAKDGYSSRSAFVDAPGFGGLSYLAHSTFQSGLWVDNQDLYQELLRTQRFTLSDAFKKAGWHTVSDDPQNLADWPPGKSFFHYDQVFSRANVGYKGPRPSYPTIPDQYTLHKFQQLELQPGHKPVFAEIDLVSSHNPWTPLPSMVPWNKLGNGTIYDDQPSMNEKADVPLIKGFVPNGISPDKASTVQKLYARSIRYSLESIISWITQLHDPNLALVMLGDEQPARVVSGPKANHDVVISVIAHPDVIRNISSWKWQPGLLPKPNAPVIRMDAFRNQFINTFSSRR